MVNYSVDDKFILSSSCKVVKGANRSVLIDYLRNNIRIIPNQYYELIELLHRQSIYQIASLIDDSSASEFGVFLEFMIQNEFAFLVRNEESFPEVSTLVHDSHVAIKDCIVEVEPDNFGTKIFSKTLEQIDRLNCDDLQVRILKNFDEGFVRKIMDLAINTDINCVELHCQHSQLTEADWFAIIEDYATLSKVFLYNSKVSKKVEHHIRRKKNASLLMGIVYYLESDLSAENCGIINMDSLSFGDISMHNLLNDHNGCLYKKMTVDKKGNIKNCPHMSKHFGNILDVKMEDVLREDSFTSVWNVKKDEVDICKDCEFRYNCTDCRAFISEEDNMHSKPLKCGYNPYTNVWEEWSQSELKNMEV